MNSFYPPLSHPNKTLIEHYKGILSVSDINDLVLLVVAFHDIGKMIENFQKKIRSLPFDGYSNHSYVSAFYLINIFKNNRETIMKRFSFITVDNFEIILLVLVNVVISHHGCLRNITTPHKNNDNKKGHNLFNYEKEWEEMIDYLKTIDMTTCVNRFFKDNHDLLGVDLIAKDIDLNNNETLEFYRSYGSLLTKDINTWQNNALTNYFNTITTFAELVNGDRRDASGNKESDRKKSGRKYAYTLENNLEWIFNNLKNDTELNQVRNKIRKMAIKNLHSYLKDNNNRVFTLTAPTGSGKTFMMMQLSVEIQKANDYKYDILYALPYLSIIDQTTKIINNDLKVNTLNYTSASEISTQLQKMLETEDSNEKTVSLREFAFSENCFDHPCIITTFIQLFETFFSNHTSKLMRLKNFRKRIFLIDEFQAVIPSQYYTLISILNEFCRKYDSYAIISTATMPCFGINISSAKNEKVMRLFKEPFQRKELLSSEVFGYEVFNRYRINFIGEVNSKSLYEKINDSTKSALLIVNTIRTSQIMFRMFETGSGFDKIYLLNAHISPFDRTKILKEINNDLKNNIRMLVISTQVIEAGVDISFPCVYRDAAPPPSIVQANGRGNRNKEFGMIDTYLFLYKNEKGEYDYYAVYHSTITKNFIDDIKSKISPMTEKEFHVRCDRYFVKQAEDVEHGEVNKEQNLIDDLFNGDFYKLGKYRLIQEDPDTHTIYVGKNIDVWNKYVSAFKNVRSATGYEENDSARIELKRIRGIVLKNSINIRTKVYDTINVEDKEGDGILGIHRLLDECRYDNRIGLILD
jgi:CRISPR-associated endonuclease/helicase Cas3